MIIMTSELQGLNECMFREMPALLFHEIHGEWIKLFKDGDVIRRVPSSDYKGGIAFSNRPVNIGEKVRLRVLKDGNGWLRSITFGFTKHNPASLTPISRSLPADINSTAAKIAGFWSVFADQHFYQEDDELFFCVNSLGTVQYGVNDKTKGTFAISEQCDRIELWAMVDINANDMIIQLVNPPSGYRIENDLQPPNENAERQENEPQDISPLRFHSTSGCWAKVSSDGCTARRLESTPRNEIFLPYLGTWADEILPPLGFTSTYESYHITASGHVPTRFHVFSARNVTVGDKICLRFFSGFPYIIFGFTNYNPDTNNEEVNYNSCFKHWGVHILGPPTLEDNILYYYVNCKGDICFGINNEDLGVYFSVVETKAPLWAILILPDDAVVQFVDAKSTQVGPAIPTEYSKLMRFHPVHGNQSAVSQDGSKAVMKKRDEKGNSAVYTYRPVEINERISLRIAVTEKCYANSCLLKFGFTRHNPGLLYVHSSKSPAGDVKILLKGHSNIFHTYVDSSGEVHFWCEGDSERRSLTSINISSSFWMFIKSNVPANVYFVETTSEPPPCRYVYNLSPINFHYIHGDNLHRHDRKLSSVQCIANESTEESREGLAFSSEPIELNKKICLRILAIPDEKSSIQIGVTTLAPTLPKRICQDPDNNSKIWIRKLDKEFCKENNNIFFYVNSSGEVLYGINGEEIGVLASGVDTSKDIWALVDISGLSTIVMFTNAAGIHQTANDHTLVDQRLAMKYCLPTHEEFNIESIETDNAMMIEERPANDNSLRFHTIHGQNVRVSKDGFEAQLVDEEDFRSGLAFTNRPLVVDEQISLRIKNYEHQICLLVFGFTNCNPKHLTETLRKNLYKPYLLEIYLPTDASLHIRLSPSLDVHFWTDELQSVTNYFEGIGRNGPVWMLIELPKVPGKVNILEPIATCQPPRGTRYNLHPITFHSVHGRNVKTYIRHTSEVECVHPVTTFPDGVAFSSRTVCVNEKIHLRILSTNQNTRIRLGFTKRDPSSLGDLNNFYKNHSYTTTLDNKYCKKDNDICFYVDSSGDIHFEINGYQKITKKNSFPIINMAVGNFPLWVVVEISGRVTLMFLNGVGRYRFEKYSSYSCLIDDSRDA